MSTLGIMPGSSAVALDEYVLLVAFSICLYSSLLHLVPAATICTRSSDAAAALPCTATMLH